MHSVPSRAILILLGSLVAGCGETPTDTQAPGNGTALVGHIGSLVQTVTVSPASPASGENIAIRSVVVNRGSAPIPIEARICGLDYAGSLELDWPAGIAKCDAYSTAVQLAPGDSIVGHDLMQVASPPGKHVLRVRHAIDPDTWVDLPIKVRAR